MLKTTGPSYFFPSAYVDASITTPYAEYLENFTVYESTDNSTWVQVPIQMPNQFIFNTVQIGNVPLNGFSIPIYFKVYFPYQNITVQNQTVLFSDFVKSLTFETFVTPFLTPQAWVIFILLIIAVFSFVLQIADFLLRDEEKKIEPYNSKESSSIGYDM